MVKSRAELKKQMKPIHGLDYVACGGRHFEEALVLLCKLSLGSSVSEKRPRGSIV